MATFISILFALVKALPAAEQVLIELQGLYIRALQQKNRNETNAKDTRDDADIDALAAQRVQLCESCPYSDKLGRLHTPAQAAPTVSPGGPSGT